MQVYKFGGASVATASQLTALWPIIAQAQVPLVIVVSAIGKTTNALEQVVAAATTGAQQLAIGLIDQIEAMHYTYAEDLLPAALYHAVRKPMADCLAELRWAIDDAGVQSNDYVYDQIVCIGELLSTLIFQSFLQSKGMDSVWIDARDIVRTDERYRHARVDLEATQQRVDAHIKPRLEAGHTVVLQGFIGASTDNNSTTLGREGSDYSAALLAAMVQADSLTIWKDVPGFLSADPRLFAHALTLPQITFHEVVELAYYGAQVIHPNTIKPLQNNGIPLYVKCFLNPQHPGTMISGMSDIKPISYPPLIVLKQRQILLQLNTLDFSFMGSENLSTIYRIFNKFEAKINMLQNAAVSFVACIDDNYFKLEELIAALSQHFKVLRNEQCSLLTIRHYTEEIIEKLLSGKDILLRQQTRSTFQALFN